MGGLLSRKRSVSPEHISPPSRILVTGANGFIAAHCVSHLLSSGFHVVGTVRTSGKAKKVIAAHSFHPNLTVSIVPDILSPTAFTEAIKGCDGVLHLAAPFGYSYKNFETDLLLPSIAGTKAICLAATAEPSVKRVVLTSSFAAVMDATIWLAPEKIYTEEDWSPLTYEDGKNASITPIAYRASKVLAEKTAWEFVEAEKPDWDLVTLCPGMVFGALIPGTIDSLKELNTSNAIVWGLVDAENVPVTKAPLWTSATTLAQAHTLALTTAKAGGERFLVLNGDFDNQELADIIHSSNLPAELKARVPVGTPGERLKGKVYSADSSKVNRVLGLDMNSPRESLEQKVVELLKQLYEMDKAAQ